ncbi:hypothetical protein EV284_6400 [Streptomyces sp. BK022]|uniref:hypothetical protein n=1 Tax=Streptomyces sp. BK022 TaxID=2512123 RepID=UPI00102A3178|nr:hypothetical protein [Streptomyces sp. BK022]RZU28234.1 hypothetical protein EV284_6400 [Streptomyces sp. BK022]
MSVLPRSTPARVRDSLTAALAGTAVELTGPAPRSAITFLASYRGAQWKVTYMGLGNLWGVTGPAGSGTEHSVPRFTDEIAATITAPWPQPEKAPADPHPGVPRTHLGVDVPELVRAQWKTPLGDGWRLGVRCAVGKLPDTRPR